MLEVRDLNVTFDTPDGPLHAVTGFGFELARGGTLGIVGESGAGKSQAMLALMGLLAGGARVSGNARFDGVELLGLDSASLNRIRGARIAMVFQDPMSGLNPYLRIGSQMAEVLVHHQGMGHAEATRHAIDMLDAVRVPDAGARIRQYPHELSGGMRQRVTIATALLCEPDILIADEPTTALDVTVQAQTLELLRELQSEFGMATILVTHDLGVVAGLCERVLVMYAGRCVERAPVEALFDDPHHPYTARLIDSAPRLDGDDSERLVAIPGEPPDPRALPDGCAFAPRCGYAFARCATENPVLMSSGPGRAKACHLEEAPDRRAHRHG